MTFVEVWRGGKRRPVVGLVLTIIAATWWIGCTPKWNSAGDAGGLLIVTDEEVRPLLREPFERTFHRHFETPQDEPLFDIAFVTAGALDSLTRAPLILLFASLDGKGTTAEFARQMLSGAVLGGAESGDYVIFKRLDEWSRNQLLLVILGRTEQELAANIETWIDTLFVWATDFEITRLERNIFAYGSEEVIEQNLLAKCGIRMRVPSGFHVEQFKESPGVARLGSSSPDLWLTIGWRPMTDSNALTQDFLFNWRKSLSKSFPEPVSIHDDHWTCDTVSLFGRSGLSLRGLWHSSAPTGGGPYFSYGIWSADKKKCYIIDGAVSAPGEAKMPYIWQLEALIRTISQ